MVKKINLFFLIAGLLIINVAGFFLRYSELDTYFIFLGFRFHFSIFIPFLFILNYVDFSAVKELFIHPVKQKFFPVLLLAFLPVLFVPFDMFILEKFKLSDKDYFFELGLSSIVDYPLYLIWNTPQMLMFFILMISIFKEQNIFNSVLLTFFLFLYEIIPMEIFKDLTSITINYYNLVIFVLAVLLAGLFTSGIKNIYIFSLVLFTVLWGAVLFFGSSSEMVVNMLLASQYESWTGLTNPGEKFEYSKYLQPAYLFLILIFSVIVLKKNKVNPGP